MGLGNFTCENMISKFLSFSTFNHGEHNDRWSAARYAHLMTNK